MANHRTVRAYLDRWGNAWSVLDLDAALAEVLAAVDPDTDHDLLLAPWRRSCQAALRSAFEQ